MAREQWTAGENFDGTGPFGPFLVTADEVPYPHDLELSTTVVTSAGEREVLQSSSTSPLVHRLPDWAAGRPAGSVLGRPCSPVSRASASSEIGLSPSRAEGLHFPLVRSGRLEHHAGFQRAIELVGKRWSGAVIKALLPGPARFNQLLSGIPGISDRVLTERLRELELAGVVERLVDAGPPVRVSYRLTARGRALEPVVAAVTEWAERWLDSSERAQAV